MPISLLELFQRGGPVMWPILLASVIALAIIIERLWAFYRTDIDGTRFLAGVSSAIQTRQLELALQLCDQTPGPLSRMIKSGIAQIGKPRTQILEAMTETASAEISSLQRYIPLLGSIGHMAPLLGLLGTVTGLVRCFQTIQEKATTLNPVNPGDLAGGIWEALLTTVFGLLVAIPAYGFYNYLAHRVNTMMHDMEQTAVKFSRFLSDESPRSGSFSETESIESHAGV
ncbi:MAG: MotA/TolQ/ExbB proton channel family protein [Candidatus Omnitrophica bacterium]|nr:MotA/TolQ/ExbB proton channel family protein [Candidatus Omnitrophota bacterium]